MGCLYMPKFSPCVYYGSKSSKSMWLPHIWSSKALGRRWRRVVWIVRICCHHQGRQYLEMCQHWPCHAHAGITNDLGILSGRFRILGTESSQLLTINQLEGDIRDSCPATKAENFSKALAIVVQDCLPSDRRRDKWSSQNDLSALRRSKRIRNMNSWTEKKYIFFKSSKSQVYH